MPEVKASINIENVVASATLKQNIDLNSVVKAFPNVEYRPEQFPGLVFRLKK
ncbi:MAG: TATA box-binding protein, partial [Candidatus Bathyarchaeota archaeon]|nr:TATA box-binding protein [Candidatus Bathyarchaeota archaeon]